MEKERKWKERGKSGLFLQNEGKILKFHLRKIADVSIITGERQRGWAMNAISSRRDRTGMGAAWSGEDRRRSLFPRASDPDTAAMCPFVYGRNDF